MTDVSDFDLAVIGTGVAAMSAAIHARLEDALAVAIERDTIGGTCVNVRLRTLEGAHEVTSVMSRARMLLRSGRGRSRSSAHSL